MKADVYACAIAFGVTSVINVFCPISMVCVYTREREREREICI